LIKKSVVIKCYFREIGHVYTKLLATSYSLLAKSMKITLVNKKVNQIKADVELILVDKSLKNKWVKDAKLFKAQGFKGELEQVLYLPEKGRLYSGVKDFKDHDNVRLAAAMGSKALKGKDIKSLKCAYYGDENIKALVEGVVLGSYVFDKFKNKKAKTIFSLNVASEALAAKVENKAAGELIKEARIEAEAQNFVRDLVDRPADDVTPTEFAHIARDLAKDKDVNIKVYKEDYLKKNKMGALLAVGQASPHDSHLIHLSYRPKGASKKVVLVGKGLTYDSGGLSLKPSDSMRTMKIDKAGASAILGVMKAVAELDLNIEVDAVLGVSENVVGKNSYKPGDVVRASNGKTIEISNTDAEGRLVLADCLVYAQKQPVDYIIDMATLTGACMVGLGNYTAGLMSYDQGLVHDFIAQGEASGESLAYLPFNRELKKLLKSEIADINHCASERYGGAITAALFLSEFIEKKYKDKWLHIDIAGPAYTEKPWGVHPGGATGFGTRLLIHWLKSIS